MESNKPLARAGYLLAAALVIIPIIDSTVPLLPLRLGDERWRWGVVGQFSNVMLVPLVGLFLAMALAQFTDARRLKRILGIIAGILALALAVMSVSFVLDYFQVRTLAKPTAQHAMGVASTTAFIKNIVSIIVLALLSRAGFAGPRVLATPAKARKPEGASVASPSPLVGVGGARPARSE
jgi:cytochrome c biogenesis factor